jgi:hypothetical protein
MSQNNGTVEHPIPAKIGVSVSKIRTNVIEIIPVGADGSFDYSQAKVYEISVLDLMRVAK